MSILIKLNDDRSEKVHYDDPDYPVYIRRSLLSSYPNYSAPSHFHNDIELIAVLSGEMHYHVNGEIVSLKANEGIFVNAGQIHFGFSDTRSECDFLCVLLHPVLLCTTHACERNFVIPLIGNAAAAFTKLHGNIFWQREIFRRIETIYAVRDEKTAPLKVQAAFSEIWSLLFDNIPPAKRQENRQDSDLTVLKNMIGFIQLKYAEKITLADIAASGAVGQSKCCKLFARYLGQTPGVYLNQYRLNKSSYLLLNTDMSIIQIALASGFGGASYYAEAFRSWAGKSPTEYRNALSGKEPGRSLI